MTPTTRTTPTTPTTTNTIHVNGVPVPYHPGVALEALIAAIGADPTGPGIAVAVNDRVVPRAVWATTYPAPGDRVEVLHAIAGG